MLAKSVSNTMNFLYFKAKNRRFLIYIHAFIFGVNDGYDNYIF